MPARPVHVRPADTGAGADAAAVTAGLAQLRAELQLPDGFPPDALAEADAAAGRPLPDRPRIDLPFVTIDPPGSMDLDQAMHLARREGGGHRVTYAIADLGAFVTPGGAIDREAHARAVTTYLPDARVPLHPPALSEAAASLLPGQDRPAFVWQLDLDADGQLVATDLRRAIVRSAARLDYAHVPEELRTLLQEVGERRLAVERARGGVSLRVPEQEVEPGGDGWTVAYRVPLATEDWNAQISLLTGMAAAQLMLKAGVGLLRTQPPPEAKAFARLRAAAAALGAPWPDALSYPEWIRTLDPAVPAHAALLHQAAGAGRGAGYTAFDGATPPPEQAGHFAIAAPYAHVTAPLRRLADRFVLELCAAVVAGEEPPASVRAELPGLPSAMGAGAQRASRAERAVVDLVEAILLSAHVGQELDAVAIDDDLVQLAAPAVRARMPDAKLPVGARVRVRVTAADPAKRTVTLAPVP